MGQCARMNRAARFIAAFEDQAGNLTAESLSVGQTLTVTEVFLGCEDGHGEEVRVCIELTDQAGEKHSLLGDEIFDPEYTDVDHEQISQWSDMFEIPYEAVQERLKEANLLE